MLLIIGVLHGGTQYAAAWAPEYADIFVSTIEMTALADANQATDGLLAQKVENATGSFDVAYRISGATVTRYGTMFNGRPLGCNLPHGGTYYSSDTTIVAVSPTIHPEWPCGTRFRIVGPCDDAKFCSIEAMRRDSCPGCGRNHFDLSEKGLETVCYGVPDTCRVTVQVLKSNERS